MKLRIDFSVREADCPPEEARGVRFGDDIDVNQIFDFFNKCRDAILTLFNQRVPKDQFKDERDRLEARIKELESELMKERLKPIREPIRTDPGRPRDQAPWEYRPDNRKHWLATEHRVPNMDDGSRGGDGPPSPEFLEAMKRLNDPNRDRY